MFTTTPHDRGEPGGFLLCDVRLWIPRLHTVWNPSSDWFPPCARGMTVGGLSVCFSSSPLSLSLSIYTGNFHVVNGGIDPGSVPFVLPPQFIIWGEDGKWKLSQVWLYSTGGNVTDGSAMTCYTFWAMLVILNLFWIPLDSLFLNMSFVSPAPRPLAHDKKTPTKYFFHPVISSGVIGGCDYSQFSAHTRGN